MSFRKQSPLRQRGAVLVVENEPLVREALVDILDTVGLQAIGVSNGPEGVATYLSQRDEIDLVILDLRLPGMDGTEILRMLRRINPFVKVIVSSGYDEQEILFRLKDQSANSILRKPYNAEMLLSKVQDVLTNRPLPPQ